MPAPRILPVTGDHFEDFLKLTEADTREEELPMAWSILKQQTGAHSGPGPEVDLNGIYVDLARMQMLVYPIVEDWKRPLSNREWQEIEEQCEELEEQMSRMHKLSVDVRKQDPGSFSSVGPLFKLLFEQNQELKKNWNQFKQTWTVYKEQWKRFQEEQEEVQKKAKSVQSKSGQEKDQEEETGPETPEPPQMFLRERWHALRTTCRLLEVELIWRFSKEPDPESVDHPGVEFLVAQLRDIFIQTKGFELLEKVKLVQLRNTQLIEELQPLYAEPIISAEIREEAQTLENGKDEEEESSKHRAAKGIRWQRGLLIAAGILGVGVLTVFIFQSPLVRQTQDEMKVLKFKPTDKTITMHSPPEDPEFINLKNMINRLNLDIPVLQPDERLLQLIGQNREKAEIAASSLMEELGRKVTFAFTAANAYFLYWKGKLNRFSSSEEMGKVMQRLEKQKKEVEELLREWTGEVPKDTEIIPENLDGKPVYGMEMVDENGEPLQIYVSSDGVRMRLSNGEFLEKTYQPEEALERLKR